MQTQRFLGDGWMDDLLLQEAAPSGPLMRAKSYITKPVLAI